MTIVNLFCPTCRQSGKVDLGEGIMKNITSGLIAVNIISNTICSHHFIVYIDRNFNIRDYFVADFQIELPEISTSMESEIPYKEIINLDLITLNLPPTLITHIIGAICYKQKIVVISEQEFLYKHIENFFRFITTNSFKIDISLMHKEDYIKNKKQFKKFIVFENIEILRNPNKIINSKKLKVEKQIVKNFITETDLNYKFIYLKNEIYKAYIFSESIINFADDYEINSQKKNKNSILNNFIESVIEKKKLISILISDYLAKKYNTKIHRYYFDFLINIVEGYFGINVFEKINLN